MDKRMAKRWLSVWLMVVMIVTMIPGTAYASQDTVSQDQPSTYAEPETSEETEPSADGQEEDDVIEAPAEDPDPEDDDVDEPKEEVSVGDDAGGETQAEDPAGDKEEVSSGELTDEEDAEEESVSGEITLKTYAEGEENSVSEGEPSIISKVSGVSSGDWSEWLDGADVSKNAPMWSDVNLTGSWDVDSQTNGKASIAYSGSNSNLYYVEKWEGYSGSVSDQAGFYVAFDLTLDVSKNLTKVSENDISATDVITISSNGTAASKTIKYKDGTKDEESGKVVFPIVYRLGGTVSGGVASISDNDKIFDITVDWDGETKKSNDSVTSGDVYAATTYTVDLSKVTFGQKESTFRDDETGGITFTAAEWETLEELCPKSVSSNVADSALNMNEYMIRYHDKMTVSWSDPKKADESDSNSGNDPKADYIYTVSGNGKLTYLGDYTSFCNIEEEQSGYYAVLKISAPEDLKRTDSSTVIMKGDSTGTASGNDGETEYKERTKKAFFESEPSDGDYTSTLIKRLNQNQDEFWLTFDWDGEKGNAYLPTTYYFTGLKDAHADKESELTVSPWSEENWTEENLSSFIKDAPDRSDVVWGEKDLSENTVSYNELTNTHYYVAPEGSELKYVTGWTGFSGTVSEQEGFYTAFALVAPDNAVSNNTVIEISQLGLNPDKTKTLGVKDVEKDNKTFYHIKMLGVSTGDVLAPAITQFTVKVDWDGASGNNYAPATYVIDLSKVDFGQKESELASDPTMDPAGWKDLIATFDDVSKNFVSANESNLAVTWTKSSETEKDASDNDCIVYTTDKTLDYFEEFTKFSDTKKEQSGYYVPFKIAAPIDYTVSDNNVKTTVVKVDGTGTENYKDTYKEFTGTSDYFTQVTGNDANTSAMYGFKRLNRGQESFWVKVDWDGPEGKVYKETTYVFKLNGVYAKSDTASKLESISVLDEDGFKDVSDADIKAAIDGLDALPFSELADISLKNDGTFNSGKNFYTANGELHYVEGLDGVSGGNAAKTKGYYAALKFTVSESDITMNDIALTIEQVSGNSTVSENVAFNKDGEAVKLIWLEADESGNIKESSKKVYVTVDFDGSKETYEPTTYTVDLSDVDFSQKKSELADENVNMDDDGWAALNKGFEGYFAAEDENGESNQNKVAVNWIVSGNDGYYTTKDLQFIEFKDFSNVELEQSGHYVPVRIEAPYNYKDVSFNSAVKGAVVTADKTGTTQTADKTISGDKLAEAFDANEDGKTSVLYNIKRLSENQKSFWITVDWDGDGLVYEPTTYTFYLKGKYQVNTAIHGTFANQEELNKDTYKEVLGISEDLFNTLKKFDFGTNDTENKDEAYFTDTIPYTKLSADDVSALDIDSNVDVSSNFIMLKINAPTQTLSGNTYVPYTPNADKIKVDTMIKYKGAPQSASDNDAWSKLWVGDNGAAVYYIAYVSECLDGERTIKVKWSDTVTDTFTVDTTKAFLGKDQSVIVEPSKLSIVSPVTKMAVGDEQQLSISITKVKPTDNVEVQISANNATKNDSTPASDILSWTADGKIKALKPGKVTITVYAKTRTQNGKEGLSEKKKASTTITVSDVAAPKGVNKSNVKDTSATLTWTTPANKPSGNDPEVQVFMIDATTYEAMKDAKKAPTAAQFASYLMNKGDATLSENNGTIFKGLRKESQGAGTKANTTSMAVGVNSKDVTGNELEAGTKYYVFVANVVENVEKYDGSLAKVTYAESGVPKYASAAVTLFNFETAKTLPTGLEWVSSNNNGPIYKSVSESEQYDVSYNETEKKENKYTMAAKVVFPNGEKEGTSNVIDKKKYSVTYTTSNKNVATVKSSGEVEIKNGGTADITATLTYKDTKEVLAEISYTLNVSRDVTIKAKSSITLYVGQTIPAKDLVTYTATTTSDKEPDITDDTVDNISEGIGVQFYKDDNGKWYACGSRVQKATEYEIALTNGQTAKVKITVKAMPAPGKAAIAKETQYVGTKKTTQTLVTHDSMRVAFKKSLYAAYYLVELQYNGATIERKTIWQDGDYVDESGNLLCDFNGLTENTTYKVRVTACADGVTDPDDEESKTMGRVTSVLSGNLKTTKRVVDGAANADNIALWRTTDDGKLSGGVKLATDYDDEQRAYKFIKYDVSGNEISGNDVKDELRGDDKPVTVNMNTVFAATAEIDPLIRYMDSDSLVWATSDSKVITVKASKSTFDATITAKKTGTAVVTVTSKTTKGIVAQFTVNVETTNEWKPVK